MADDNNDVVDNENDSGENNTPDPIKQVKSEMDRKFNNQNEYLKSVSEQLKTLTESIAAAQATKNQPKEEEVDPMLEPEKFKNKVVNEAVGLATKAVSEMNTKQQATQQVIASIAGEYPEFSKPNSEATTLALSKFQSLPKSLQGTPEGAKLVLYEVAQELGLEKASRRRSNISEDDDAASGGGSAPTNRSRSKGKTDLSPKTLAFAEQLGMDTSDPEVVKRLTKSSENRGGKWGSYR